MKHVLITRVPGTANFANDVFVDGELIRKDRVGGLLNSIIPNVKEDLRSANGNVCVTISSKRNAAQFPNPDDASIVDGTVVLLLAPVEDAVGDVNKDTMRSWAILTWDSPDSPPSASGKLRQNGIVAWLDEFFGPAQLDEWKRYNSEARVEIWIRPTWNVAKLFPDLFPHLQDDDNKIVRTPTPPPEKKVELTDVPLSDEDGKPVVRIKFSPRTMWRLFGVDGNEVSRGIPTKEEAQEEMKRYLISHELRLPEPQSPQLGT